MTDETTLTERRYSTLSFPIAKHLIVFFSQSSTWWLNSGLVKKCLFCKAKLSESGRALEHVVPKWLQAEWKLSEMQVEPTHSDENSKILSHRKHNYDSFLAGNVCAQCNNGWMSSLENQCKRLILDLAACRRHVRSLSNKEALLIARWTVKTAFVLHCSSNWRRVVPENHIYMLDSESYHLPDNVFVVGHTFNASKKFSWSQSTTWEIHAKDHEVSAEELALLKAQGYKIALRIGGLFLMVFHNPLPTAINSLWKTRHIPLYPRWSKPVMWREENRSWPSKAEVRFMVFVYYVGLCFDKSGTRNSQPF